MLSLEDCIALSGLTEEEVLVIARHEHIPEIAATELGNYLVRSPDGELCIKAMIRDDIATAAARGDRVRELTLKMVMRGFIVEHPRTARAFLKQIDLGYPIAEARIATLDEHTPSDALASLLDPLDLEDGGLIAEAGAGLHQAALMYLGLVLFLITFVVLILSKLLLAQLKKNEGART